MKDKVGLVSSIQIEGPQKYILFFANSVLTCWNSVYLPLALILPSERVWCAAFFLCFSHRLCTRQHVWSLEKSTSADTRVVRTPLATRLHILGWVTSFIDICCRLYRLLRQSLDCLAIWGVGGTTLFVKHLGPPTPGTLSPDKHSSLSCKQNCSQITVNAVIFRVKL